MANEVNRLNRAEAARLGLPFTPLPKPTEVARESLKAFVSAGRWVVECPCRSAQLVCPSDPRFFCVECQNFSIGGKFYRIEFPDSLMRVAIERELLKWPNRMQQNWMPDWKLDDIRRGSIAVGGPRK